MRMIVDFPICIFMSIFHYIQKKKKLAHFNFKEIAAIKFVLIHIDDMVNVI